MKFAPNSRIWDCACGTTDGAGVPASAGDRFGKPHQDGAPTINTPRMERDVSRRPVSVACLMVCTALLWGAWRLTATVDSASGVPEALPELQFSPFGPRSSA